MAEFIVPWLLYLPLFVLVLTLGKLADISMRTS